MIQTVLYSGREFSAISADDASRRREELSIASSLDERGTED